MTRVTAERLRAMGACEHQVAIVEREWPRGVPVTVQSIRKAYRLGLDVEWCADRVLPYSALAEYAKIRAPALAEYAKVRAAALAEYEKVRAAALAEYEKVRAAALAEYAKVTAPALAEYAKVTAPALAPLLRSALATEDAS